MSSDEGTGDARTPGPPIRSGARREPPRRRATSYDVARLAGVSQSAVSRCFSPGRSASPDMRQRVEEAARALGYVPGIDRRGQVGRQTGLVGLIARRAILRHAPQLLHEIGDALERAGLVVMLATVPEEGDLGGLLPRLAMYKPEAIVSLASVNAGLLRQARRGGMAIVVVNRPAAEGLASSVRCDNRGGARALARRIGAAGHRCVAIISGPRSAPVSMERVMGFEQGLAEHGLVAAALTHCDYTYDGGRQAALALLARRPAVEALLCVNDEMAFGAMDACRYDLGLTVPKDVSVTGFDDVADSARPNYALTTVRQPVLMMAETVVEHILARRNGPVSEFETLLPTEVVVRSSARLQPCAGPPDRM